MDKSKTPSAFVSFLNDGAEFVDSGRRHEISSALMPACQSGHAEGRSNVGNLLGLNFYPCDSGQMQCANGNNGRIWRQTITANGSFQAQHEYRYDALNRLTLAEEKTTNLFAPACPDADPLSVWCEQYSYDAAGNRTVSSQSGAGVAGMAGQVSSIRPSTNKILDAGWSYDSAGTFCRRGRRQTMTYGAENRQVTFLRVRQLRAVYLRWQRAAGAEDRWGGMRR